MYSPSLKRVPRLWIHILIWAAMLTYVAIAPDLYVRYFVKEGKPVPFDRGLPPPSDQIAFAVDNLDAIQEQEFFSLWGWCFLRGDRDQSAYTRWVVLQSDARTYFFPAKTFRRQDVQSAFADLDIDISNAGFSTMISKFAIEPGTYQIGILLRNETDDTAYYVITNKVILRTTNQMRLDVSAPPS